MAFIPRVSSTNPGMVELVSAVSLANGRFLRDVVRLEAAHLDTFADRLLDWHDRRLGDHAFEIGADSFSLTYGGTDWEPRLIIVNFRENGGSLSMGADDVPELVAAIREASRR